MDIKENININENEKEMLAKLTGRYEKLIKPGVISRIGKKAGKIVPQKIKIIGKNIGSSISEQEIYNQVMKILVDGFKIVEEQAAKFTISEKQIIENVNRKTNYDIDSLEKICLIQSSDISKLVNTYKTQDTFIATIEGAGTGWFGFAGIPFNLVLSTFIYFRAVQSIAMYYGYDVKNDSSEMVIASEVFTNALNPKEDLDNATTSIIGKIMVMSQLSIVKQTASKGWAEMISKGGIPLLLAEMRALANKAAQKALEKAGQKGLENTVFREAFEQVGKKLSLKSLGGKSIPVASAVIGGLMDTSQMRKVLEYADIFYNKRFIFEKEDKNKKLKQKNITIEAKIVED